jgi:hypothetical protein
MATMTPTAAVAPVRLLRDATGELGGITDRQASGWRGRNRGCTRKADAACHQQRSQQCPHVSSFNLFSSSKIGQIPDLAAARFAAVVTAA